jgi:Aerotolerance regulator N-terminal/von Willebrand factor type A domain
MSFLTPLYVLGVSAIVAPLIFHLIRRSPRGEVPFSSLMFLSPTPPRLTRRSRLDQLLLLLLRAAALCLLAFAFARPFMRQEARLDFGDEGRRRVALLIDTSASMRRGELWPRAQALAHETIASCRPEDELALYSFDATAQPLLTFSESATLDPKGRQAQAGALVDRLAPSWAATDLGQALVDVVAAIEDVADRSTKSGRIPRRVVLISDLSEGSRLDALGEFEWPKDVELDLKTVAGKGSNAGLEVLAETTTADPVAATERRARVYNDRSSRVEKFELHWVDEEGKSNGKPIDVYVPPGESRVVRVPRLKASGTHRALRLTGDTFDFDNTAFLADDRPEDLKVVFAGLDRPDDTAGLFYYLERVFVAAEGRNVTVAPSAPTAALALEPVRSIPLVVVASEMTAENNRRLLKYLEEGGTVLYVLARAGRAETFAALAKSDAVVATEAAPRPDVMLREISFDHPLFSSFAAAQFNDFTKIHFWKYRRIDAGASRDARVLARFESGDPAIIEKPVGKGRLVVFTSGWQPADSQLARSSKFVPLMLSLLELGRPPLWKRATFVVGARVPLPATEGAGSDLVVHTPDGAKAKVAAGAGVFAETEQPGVYTIETPAGQRPFAVNLDSAESKTAPLNHETLEQLGCRLVSHSKPIVDHEQIRQMQNAELENRQKLWRWLILAAIAVLTVETYLAGRTAVRSRLARAEVVAT